MDINKAIRKQNSSYKRFMLIMCFIFFVLPTVLYVSKRYTVFLIIYLLIIELLILFAMFIRSDGEALSYQFHNGKFQFCQGIIKKKYNINCEKVIFVHVEKNEEKEDINIIILLSNRSRNKNIQLIDQGFLKNHGYISHEYKKIKSLYPEEQYYYAAVTKGVYIKYKMLMELYKNCVNTKYSDEAIEAIKQWSN